MRETRDVMGMPATIEVAEPTVTPEALKKVFDYLIAVDKRFSTYKNDSEISRINRGEISEHSYSNEMSEIMEIAKKTKKETGGYFDIQKQDGTLDPSGVVKGWAIFTASHMLTTMGYKNFYIDIAGDIASSGSTEAGAPWSIGIRNPFNKDEIVKVIYPCGNGVATSGSYVRGQHIYNPHDPTRPLLDIVSITVVGSDVLEADLFATAAFAMGQEGIHFIEKRQGLEGYAIDRSGVATMTDGFNKYTTI